MRNNFKNIVVFVVLAASFAACEKSNKGIARKPDVVIQIQNGDSSVSNYQIACDPIVGFYGEAFPVKILATASLKNYPDGSPRMVTEGEYIGDTLGDFGVALTISGDTKEDVLVVVEIEGDRFIKKSREKASIPMDTTIEIFPRLSYDYNALEHLTQPTTENVSFKIFINNTPVDEKQEVVRFHSVNEVPFRERSRLDDETPVDNSWLFAAYVNEDDPLIDTILKEALEIGTVDKIGLSNSFSFGGYQDIDGDDDTVLEVELQVLAVWSVFQRHNIKYSNITTTSTENNFLTTQYVRTLKESFANAQANCVDGSVLFASVLRKLGIRPFLVLVPGHMFVGYYLDENMEEVEFLETTMLGNEDISKYTKDDSLLGKAKRFTGIGKTQSSVSRDSFIAATVSGETEFEEAAEFFDDPEKINYQIIDIADWRNRGVMPISRY